MEELSCACVYVCTYVCVDFVQGFSSIRSHLFSYGVYIFTLSCELSVTRECWSPMLGGVCGAYKVWDKEDVVSKVYKRHNQLLGIRFHRSVNRVYSKLWRLWITG